MIFRYLLFFEEFSHSVLGLEETIGTIGMREAKIGWMHVVCSSIRFRRDPERSMRRRIRFVTNESAGTTNRKKVRLHIGLWVRQGSRLVGWLCGGFLRRHRVPRCVVTRMVSQVTSKHHAGRPWPS